MEEDDLLLVKETPTPKKVKIETKMTAAMRRALQRRRVVRNARQAAELEGN
jgi:hypothetical protein